MMYMDPSGPVASVREAVVRMKTWRWMHSRHSAQNWSNLDVDVPRWELRLCETHNTLLDQLPDITEGMAEILKANKNVRTTTQLTQAGIAQEAIDQWQRCGIFLLGTEDESLGGWNWSARTPIDTPHQNNNYDCGMFVLLYIIYCTRGWTMNYTQEHMEHCRSWFLRTLISVGSWEESFTCRSCSDTFFSGASQPQICASCHQGPVGGKRACPSKQRRAATDQCTSLRTLSVSRGRTTPPRGKKVKLTTQAEVTVGRRNSEALTDMPRCVENSSKEAPGSSTVKRQCDQGDTNGTSQDIASSPRYVAVGTPELPGGPAARQHSTGVGTADQRDDMRDGKWPDTGSGAASHTTQTRDDHLDLEDRLELPSGSSTTPEVVTGGDVCSETTLPYCRLMPLPLCSCYSVTPDIAPRRDFWRCRQS